MMREPASPRRTLRAALAASALLLLFAAPALARVRVEVKTDVSNDGTRVLLNHSSQVPYLIEVEDKKIKVIYGESVSSRPARGRVRNSVLKRFGVEDGDTLVFHVGDEYLSYQTFELRNPFRLVIDIQSSRSVEDDILSRLDDRDRSRPIVVIDPGHGGMEEGAIGPGGLIEKNVTLDLARRLKRLLESGSSIDVVLTRDDDRLVGLDERTAIANHNRAALFLSIHLNASRRRNATGAETYYLSTDATDDEARTLAALENRASGVEKGQFIAHGGTQKQLDLVLWDLAQNQHLAQSSLLAESVQRQLNALAGTRDRGVRQAPFRVLMGATMPAVLIEVAFVSNPDEERQLRSRAFRDKTVRAIGSAVIEFLGRSKRTSIYGSP
ncbi:MAG: N-acetylmuramoyl-L-alanine amidase [bacterium]|nr:N-acetylmuramoyl-L-alanine amidase [bacterium]